MYAPLLTAGHSEGYRSYRKKDLTYSFNTQKGKAMQPRRCPSQKKSEKAKLFTLVELLVVISIIAVLAGMLLPALSKAKAKGTQISCSSNQKQCALGNLLYATTYNEIIFCQGGFSSSGYYPWSKMLVQELNVLPESVIYCPSGKNRSTNAQYTRYYGYGLHQTDDFYNGSTNGYTQVSTLSDGYRVRNIVLRRITNPSSMYLLTDSLLGLNNYNYDYSLVLTKNHNDKNYADARHNGMINLAFMDGHCDSLKPAAYLKQVNDAAIQLQNWDVTRYCFENGVIISGK